MECDPGCVAAAYNALSEGFDTVSSVRRHDPYLYSLLYVCLRLSGMKVWGLHTRMLSPGLIFVVAAKSMVLKSSAYVLPILAEITVRRSL